MGKRLEDLAEELKTSIPDTGILAISYEENGSRIGFLDLATKNVQEVGIGVHPRWDHNGTLWFARESEIVHLDDATREIPVATFEHEILDLQPTPIGIYVVTVQGGSEDVTLEYWLVQGNEPKQIHTAQRAKRTDQVWTITHDGRKIAVPHEKKDKPMHWRVYFPANDSVYVEIAEDEYHCCFHFCPSGRALAELCSVKYGEWREVPEVELERENAEKALGLRPKLDNLFDRTIIATDYDSSPFQLVHLRKKSWTIHKIKLHSPITQHEEIQIGEIRLQSGESILAIDEQTLTLDYMAKDAVHRKDLLLQIETTFPCNSLSESAKNRGLSPRHLIAFTANGAYFPRWEDDLTIIMQGSFETGNANGLCALNYPVTELKVRTNE